VVLLGVWGVARLLQGMCSRWQALICLCRCAWSLACASGDTVLLVLRRDVLTSSIPHRLSNSMAVYVQVAQWCHTVTHMGAFQHTQASGWAYAKLHSQPIPLLLHRTVPSTPNPNPKH
jgi:hypothetical protein